MRTRTLRMAVVTAMAGIMLQFGFGGCLGEGFFRAVAANIVAGQVSTFIPDFTDFLPADEE